VGKPCPPSRDVAKPVDSHENVDMACMACMVTANTVVTCNGYTTSSQDPLDKKLKAACI
jgi:hypothetical protein